MLRSAQVMVGIALLLWDITSEFRPLCLTSVLINLYAAALPLIRIALPSVPHERF